MKTLELKPGFFWTGVLDPELRVFDIIMTAEHGTTYNAYLLKGNEKTALFETVKDRFWEEFLEKLNALGGADQIDYLIVNHTEPDHAGNAVRLMELNPNLTVVGTSTALTFLKQIANRDFNRMVVKEGDTLQLGGKTLRFFPLPNLHWPDTMYTYIEELETLITCDSFGAHYSHKGILRSTVTDEEAYWKEAKYYFDNILGPFKNPFMTRALDRVEGLKVDLICPGHGPVLDSHLDELLSRYRAWCAPAPKAKSKVVAIPYVSAYGYTAMLAEAIAGGIRESGAEADLYDMVTCKAPPVLEKIAAADGVLFGTPTILNEALKPIWDLTALMFPAIYAGKYASAFGSYGWSGEGVPHIIERLKQMRLKVPNEGLRVQFRPDEAALKGARDFGFQFGQLVQGKADA